VHLSRSDQSLRADNRTAPRSGGGGSALGLVSLEQSKCQTSNSRQAQPFNDENQVEIDSHLNRLKRMKSSVLTAQRLHTEQSQAGGFRSKWAMVTLTYRPGVEWSPGHVRMLSTHMREWLKRRGVVFRFVWVAELQQRGAVHYHILVLLPKGLTMPKPDKQGWWPHGSTRIEWAKCAGGYLAKYASKGDDGFFPKGCRIHGSGGLEGDYLKLARWWKRPKYVREAFPSARDRVVRPCSSVPWVDDDTGQIYSSGWLNLDTGQHVESDWFFAGFIRQGVYVLRRKPPKGDPSRV
jgi:hypothetical protein